MAEEERHGPVLNQFCLWLFAAQGDHRVDAGGAAGGDVTGEKRNQGEQGGDCDEGQRVC